MSEFSTMLSRLIKSRDVSVSALVKYCCLDRSTMYKFINGKRLPPSPECVGKMAEYMNLDPLEAKELLDAYRLTQLGEETYYSRKGVLDFMLSFGAASPKLDAESVLSSDWKITPPPSYL